MRVEGFRLANNTYPDASDRVLDREVVVAGVIAIQSVLEITIVDPFRVGVRSTHGHLAPVSISHCLDVHGNWHGYLKMATEGFTERGVPFDGVVGPQQVVVAWVEYSRPHTWAGV